jgi:hypothetical protein
MTATTTVITKSEYERNIKNKVGSLCFPADYWNATFYVKQYAIKKQFRLKGKIEVIITTDNHPEFKNIQNRDIPFKHAMCCDKTHDGALYENSSWVYYYPVGDVFIITK